MSASVLEAPETSARARQNSDSAKSTQVQPQHTGPVAMETVTLRV